MTRHIDCHYPASTTKVVGRRARDKGGDDVPAAGLSTTAHLTTSDPPDDIDYHPLQDELATLVPAALETSGNGWFDWNNPIFDFAEPLSNWQAKGDAVQFSQPLTSTLIHEPPPSALPKFIRQHAVSSPYMSIPRQPLDILGSLVQRPKTGPKTQRTATLILKTLKSYPLMLLQPDSLPPFVHPRMIASAGAENDNMEPLNNCISLLHMVRSGVPGNRKLFWRNVRMECERFYQEVRRQVP
jgi:hypothetical protein